MMPGGEIQGLHTSQIRNLPPPRSVQGRLACHRTMARCFLSGQTCDRARSGLLGLVSSPRASASSPGEKDSDTVKISGAHWSQEGLELDRSMNAFHLPAGKI